MQKKPLKKNQHPFMIKNASKNGHRGNLPYMKSPQQTLFSMLEKLSAFPLSSGTRQGCPFSPQLFSIVLKVLAMEIRE